MHRVILMQVQLQMKAQAVRHNNWWYVQDVGEPTHTITQRQSAQSDVGEPTHTITQRQGAQSDSDSDCGAHEELADSEAEAEHHLQSVDGVTAAGRLARATELEACWAGMPVQGQLLPLVGGVPGVRPRRGRRGGDR